MTQSVIAAACMLFVSLTGYAQSPNKFDFASVDRVDFSKFGDQLPYNEIENVTGDEVTLRNVTLTECLRIAYGLSSSAEIDGPDWIRSRQFLYDIHAMFPQHTTLEQVQTMMQTLLAERFHLVLQKEQRSVPHYELAVAEGGSKMQRVNDDTGKIRSNQAPGGGYIGPVLTMPLLARYISGFEEKLPVIDQTSLTGMYRIDLHWRANDTGALHTALLEQLGLRLELQNGPVKIITVKSAASIPAQN
jgi:uncharacterized protein (TIGR03435 family)